MRLSLVLLVVVGILLALGVTSPSAQDQEDVRGAFLTSRPKDKPQNTSQSTTRPPRKRPKPSPTPERVNPTPVPVSSPTPRDKPPTNAGRARIGVGITLFTRDSNGLAVRTDPSHVFRRGDRVRVLLETNSDGFLYIFNTTNDGPPVMIYPQIELDEGGNYLQAHVPFEIPDGLNQQERLRWFAFDENAGNERLYFVFSKQPLTGVPIEDELLAFCKQANANCPLRPSAELWVQMQSNLKLPVGTDRSTEYGVAQTNSEKQASTRGIGLAQDDPQPSMIMMASSNTSILVTSLDLIHK